MKKAEQANMQISNETLRQNNNRKYHSETFFAKITYCAKIVEYSLMTRLREIKIFNHTLSYL